MEDPLQQQRPNPRGNDSKDQRLSIDELQKLLHRAGMLYPIAQMPGVNAEYYAIPYQTILVVKKGGLLGDLIYKEGKTTSIPMGTVESIEVDVLRVSEFPNYEYGEDSYLVLINWSRTATNSPLFIDFVVDGVVLDQIYDIALVGYGDPLGNPGDPMMDSATAALNNRMRKVLETDFPGKGNGCDTYTPGVSPVVAVVDSGLRYDLSYKDASSGLERKFLVAKPLTDSLSFQKEAGGAVVKLNGIGYNCVTDNLLAGKETPLSGAGGFVQRPHFQGLTKAEILANAFDDHRIEYDQGNVIGGRHGSIVSGIVNSRKQVPILPVKAFNTGGYTTFFDLLCGMNYIMACEKHGGLAVKVINLSFAGTLYPDAHRFLGKKIEEFERLGIWVVAAAGNLKQSLSVNDGAFANPGPLPAGVNVFPACYGEMEKVITVTSVRQMDQPTDLFNVVLRLVRNLLGSIFGCCRVRNTYAVTGNFSEKYVSVGVVEDFDTPFDNLDGDKTFEGTSFAAAFVSKEIINYLIENPGQSVSKVELLDAIGSKVNGRGLNGYIKNGRKIKYKVN